MNGSKVALPSANATGPRSIAGKVISSQNAWKHGLTAATFSLREWMKPAFEKFESDPMGSDADARKYDRLDRYKLRYERDFYRALREEAPAESAPGASGHR